MPKLNNLTKIRMAAVVPKTVPTINQVKNIIKKAPIQQKNIVQGLEKLGFGGGKRKTRKGKKSRKGKGKTRKH